MTIEEAYRQMIRAERRADAARAAHDPTGLAIAEGQAAHWLVELLNAESAAALSSRTSPTASDVLTHS